MTWLFQVMPVFFFVGGFSNSVSWESAQRKKLGYASLVRRPDPAAHRAGAAAGARVGRDGGGGARQRRQSDGMIRIGSQVALVPVWFLAVYILVVALVPLTHAAWKRWGFASVVTPVVGAVLVDLGTFAPAIGWHSAGSTISLSGSPSTNSAMPGTTRRLAGVEDRSAALCRRDS